ncbi:MAG: tRNA (adenosine(37)-N6)-threonylcarbamoyltransferase complex ATPase subunit type 1 TsaE [Pseudomonadota bacterium]
MTVSDRVQLENEAATLAIAAQFARALNECTIVYLNGDLGAGKTCFSRGVIHALGFDGRVKSPTFTLVELYELASGRSVFHFDFYRLSDPDEVYYLGIDDYVRDGFVCLMEWPSKAQGCIPQADVVVNLEHAGESRVIELIAVSDVGAYVLERMSRENNEENH